MNALRERASLRLLHQCVSEWIKTNVPRNASPADVRLCFQVKLAL